MLILSPFKRAVRVERTRRPRGQEGNPFSHECLKSSEDKHLRRKHIKMKKWHFLCYKKNVTPQPLSLGLPVMSEDSNLLLGVEELYPPLLEGDVVEIPLLLPGWQASILETVAHQRGLTAGAMVRHLVQDFLAGKPSRRGQASRECTHRLP
jgi:hypothetical protein